MDSNYKAAFSMAEHDQIRKLYPHLSGFRMLPSIDWNIKFYGGHVGQVKKGWSAPLEAHIGFEVLMILEGQQTTTIYGEQFELYKGDIMIIPSGTEHLNRCEHEQGLTYFCAHFNIDDPLFRIQMLRQQELIFRSGTEQHSLLQEIISKWLAMFNDEGHYTSKDYFTMQMILFQLCVTLTLFWQDSTNSLGSNHDTANRHQAAANKNKRYPEPPSPTAIHYAKMIAEKLKLYFNAHTSGEQPFDLAELKIEPLIESLGISSGYGLEVFKSVYGISPRKYLSELKLHEAKVLIQQSHLSLSDIAERLGYSHLSHFSRQFKRWTGMSPIAYRKQVSML